jgi:hypothetical protein
MTKKKVFDVSVPVWVTYKIKADNIDEAIEQAKFNVTMNRRTGSLSEPHWNLARVKGE